MTLPGVALDAVVSTQPVKRQFGARVWCRDLEAVPWPRIDGAIIASAAASHPELATEMLVRNVPTLVEKPLARSGHEALGIARQARRRQVLVMVALVHLYSDAFSALRRELAGQHITRIRAVGGNAGPYRTDCAALWDYGPHDLAMVLALLRSQRHGERETLRASHFTIADVHQHCDVHGGVTTDAVLELEDHTRIELSFGSAMQDKQRWLEVQTARGTYRYDDLAASKLTHGHDGVTTDVPIGNGWPLTRTLEAFCRHIRARKHTHPSLALSVESCRLLERMERAVTRSDS